MKKHASDEALHLAITDQQDRTMGGLHSKKRGALVARLQARDLVVVLLVVKDAHRGLLLFGARTMSMSSYLLRHEGDNAISIV